ncbi:glycosyltransferase family 2 protein [Opitutales bacterium ASA1]|uniref:glycosyltransferase n=1 Tax=Congregicoccus parvus TaxID=3081749 RepID=UPI002B304E12|nr:glycosyltransferase family 2 protein [Opitutales bacterium ASA1]
MTTDPLASSATDATKSSSAESTTRPEIAIVVPVFNDWSCVRQLLEALDAILRSIDCSVEIVLVDDGSTEPSCTIASWIPTQIDRVVILELDCNLGHQRAIAVGLDFCMRQSPGRAVLVMDGDGEDSPSDVPVLIAAHARSPRSVVVASRSKRSESIHFRFFYCIYKIVFRLLTGRHVDFGNFCILPAASVRRIVHMHESWNHLAATLLRSRLQLERLRTARGRRFAGRSSMNLVGLVTHGFSAVSVFSDVVLTRLLILATATAGVALAAGGTAAALRAFTDLAIPGWATSVVGFSVLLLFQTLSLLAVMIFVSLSNRSSVPFVPARRAADYVRQTLFVFDRNARGDR